MIFYMFISSPEPKALGELVGLDLSRLRPFTLSDMNIFESSWPIVNKFRLKHYWGRGLLHEVLGQMGLELWFPWQQIAPIGL